MFCFYLMNLLNFNQIRNLFSSDFFHNRNLQNLVSLYDINKIGKVLRLTYNKGKHTMYFFLISVSTHTNIFLKNRIQKTDI